MKKKEGNTIWVDSEMLKLPIFLILMVSVEVNSISETSVVSLLLIKEAMEAQNFLFQLLEMGLKELTQVKFSKCSLDQVLVTTLTSAKEDLVKAINPKIIHLDHSFE